MQKALSRIPSLRGRGIGRQLLRAACGHAAERLGLSRLEANIRPGNAASLALFAGCGFVCRGTKDGLAAWTLSLPPLGAVVNSTPSSGGSDVGFSAEWDQCYDQGGQAIRWPWSDLIGFVMRYARPTGPDFRILELGCGSGGNILFFKSLGCQYYTVEGSRLVLEQVVWKNHPDLKDKAFQGDFTAELPVPSDFDLIVDRSSLICNNEAAIRRGLALARGKLKPGGKYIAIDWFSTRHPEFQRGRAAEDARTRTGFEDGVFANLGRIHFCDRAHLLDLFGGFEMVVLEHKLIERELPDDGWKIATWNLVARKPA